jgi:hypothetical protein
MGGTISTFLGQYINVREPTLNTNLEQAPGISH